MKHLFFILVCLALTMNTRAQDSDTSNLEYEVIDQGDEVEIVTDEIVKDAKRDTTSFTLGDKQISIIEENGETSVKIKSLNDSEDSEYSYDSDADNDSIEDEVTEEDNTYSDNEDKESSDGKFKGHWSGFEFGPNNYVNSDFSMTRDAESEFLDLNTGKSWNYNFNFSQYSLPIISDRFGLVTGLGFEWSNYHFANNNSIQKLDGTVQPVNLNFEPIKNRLQTTYLTVPLIAEVQIFKGERDDRLYVSGGIIGGIKLFSNTKYKYNQDGTKQKEKHKDDYYLRPLRYGVTGRIGYKMVKLYVNYYLTSLFIDDRGPELYPVAAGLSLAF